MSSLHLLGSSNAKKLHTEKLIFYSSAWVIWWSNLIGRLSLESMIKCWWHQICERVGLRCGLHHDIILANTSATFMFMDCRQGSLEVLESVAQKKPLLFEIVSSLDSSQRGILGRKCKDLLDHGRLLWLDQHGLDVKIVMYISSTVTPENKLLLARKCYS